ncbi:DUF2624 domain-containing protein [Virgibacillus sediminis]|uniref:DUF2624 domain-containing protein n=1 Tax=Virgibacillus sediminis TaxID=202260 RepID=A0ABV7A614_9BACI
MSEFIAQLIRNKLRQLTAEEIGRYGAQYGFNITKAQANQIADYLRKHSYDPFNATDRRRMWKELAKITDQATAQKAQRLFHEIIRSYGVEHLFEK